MQIQIIKPKPNVQMSFLFWEPVGLRFICIAILIVDNKDKTTCGMNFGLHSRNSA